MRLKSKIIRVIRFWSDNAECLAQCGRSDKPEGRLNERRIIEVLLYIYRGVYAAPSRRLHAMHRRMHVVQEWRRLESWPGGVILSRRYRQQLSKRGVLSRASGERAFVPVGHYEIRVFPYRGCPLSPLIFIFYYFLFFTLSREYKANHLALHSKQTTRSWCMPGEETHTIGIITSS